MQNKMNYKQLSEDITTWIAEYTLSNKLDTLHIGVSGGIDSAVVSTLCAKTGIKIYCYNLPCMSHPENSKNANLQLNWLKSNFDNVYTSTHDLSNTFITFKSGLTLDSLALANTKSRLRMVFLYAQANHLNGLVISTGNFIEDMSVFYYTKGGDGLCDISPIGNLMKSEVRELGRYLGVPQEIITAIPNDGLYDDLHQNSDEKKLGASYDELEWAYYHLRDREIFNDLVVLTKRQQEVIEIYQKWHNKGKHKSLPMPVFKVEHSKYQNKEVLKPNNDGSFSVSKA